MAECLLLQSHQYLIPHLVQSWLVDSLGVVVAVRRSVGCPSCFEWYAKGQTGEGEPGRFAEMGRVENPLVQGRTGSVAAASLESFLGRLILKDPELS